MIKYNTFKSVCLTGGHSPQSAKALGSYLSCCPAGVHQELSERSKTLKRDKSFNRGLRKSYIHELYLYFTCNEHSLCSIHGAVSPTVSERREFYFMSLKNRVVYFSSSSSASVRWRELFAGWSWWGTRVGVMHSGASAKFWRPSKYI